MVSLGQRPWNVSSFQSVYLVLDIAEFRLKLKKVGKTTRPYRYDLNQIPYDYTVEVRNRFKGLDRSDRQSAWWTMDGGSWHCTGDRDQDHSHRKEMQKKQNGCLGRPYK